MPSLDVQKPDGTYDSTLPMAPKISREKLGIPELRGYPAVRMEPQDGMLSRSGHLTAEVPT